MNLRTILFSQYPALFLLAVLFLIAHLRVRKTSAVKSVLWVILFGARVNEQWSVEMVWISPRRRPRQSAR